MQQVHPHVFLAGAGQAPEPAVPAGGATDGAQLAPGWEDLAADGADAGSPGKRRKEALVPAAPEGLSPEMQAMHAMMEGLLQQNNVKICEQMGGVVDQKLAPVIHRIDGFETRIKEL